MFDTGTASRPPAMAGPMLSRIWRFAWWLTRDEVKAEALASRSCIEARRQGLTMDADSEQALCETFAVVCTQWYTHFARKQRLREASAMRAPRSHRANGEAGALFAQTLEATQALPDHHRIVILLVLVEGFTEEQAASILGIPVHALVQRLAQARIEIGRFLLRTQTA